MSGFSALFYSPDLDLGKLQQYALGFFVPTGELVEFTEDTESEAGHEVARELGVPYLDGMDEVVVAEARLDLHARSHEVEVDFELREPAGEKGVVIALDRPARLYRVHLRYDEPAASTDPSQVVRLVVRGAEPQGSGFAIGPPLFADPSFPPPGPMYPPVLAGLSVVESGSSRVVTLPRPLGSAWLIQVARASSAIDLQPLDVTPTVEKVVIDSAPTNLAVEMATEGGAVPLWSHPEMLLPDAGPQQVDFATLAQRELSTRLEAAGEAAVTLPVALTFRSETRGALTITDKRLTARYQARPLESEPLTLRLGGSRAPLDLAAPSGLRPLAAALDLTAEPLGRELNRASPEPPVGLPSSGLVVTLERSVAAEARYLPLEEAPPEEQPLETVRLWVEADAESEAVLEIRSSVAAVPGESLAAPIARVVEAGFSGWLEFELAEPLVLAAAETALWLELRLNKGQLLWFTVPADETEPEPPAVLLSTDGGSSWGEPEGGLGHYRPLLVQLFQRSLLPLPRPIVRLLDGPRLLAADLLAGGLTTVSESGATEITARGRSLPSGLLDLLAGAGESARGLVLYSPTLLDLTLESLVLSYDPFQAASPLEAGGG
jgi:hypothetical protein